jgi:hypothetical protein
MGTVGFDQPLERKSIFGNVGHIPTKNQKKVRNNSDI